MSSAIFGAVSCKGSGKHITGVAAKFYHVTTEGREAFDLVSSPNRLRIYALVESSEKPMYARQIAKKLKIERRLASFHLSWLEKHGYITGEFGVYPSRIPRAVRYYKGKGKAKEVKELLEVFERLRKTANIK